MVDLQSLRVVPTTPMPPNRVVSLVPSVTESLFVLGFGDTVVGVTDFCTEPKGQVSRVKKVGGTKNIDVDQILALDPDLVFANQEENSEDGITKLVEAGVPVWLAFPKTVDDAMNDLRGLLAIYHSDKPAMVLNTLQMALDWARGASEEVERLKYFCPIWMDTKDPDQPWWMTFNNDTYTHSLLDAVGGENVFANRERKYPLAADLGKADPEPANERDIRYPRVTQDEILDADPDLIILPSEPFEFGVAQKKQVEKYFAFSSAVRNDRVIMIDGSILMWHGVRLGQALQDLPNLFMG